MSNPESVLDKARAMTAEATRLRQDVSAEHDANRVSERVGEVLPLLQRLCPDRRGSSPPARRERREPG